jgi:hypothetical protein
VPERSPADRARAWAEAPRLSPEREARVLAGAAHATRFFMGEADVQRALEALTRRLEEEEIPYAIVGALALVEYGYRRVTVDVDVLLTREGLARFKQRWLGHGYVERVAGGQGVRDTEHGVPIDFLLAGDYPGDGLPKPVAFPDPALSAVRGRRIALLPLAKLLELKLASGLTAPHRLRDLADALELIRAAGLPLAFAAELDPFVRDKFRELWRAAQAANGAGQG